MRIPRIYSPQIMAVGDCIQLENGAAHHLTTVLRMAVGQPVTLFNGHGGEFSGELVACKKDKASVLITAFQDIHRESPLSIHLAIGISRGERMDWIVQKASELGVTEITPLLTARCEVKLSGQRLHKKHRHWQQVSMSACEQCQRNRLPVVNAPVQLDAWLAVCEQPLKLVLHHRTDKRLSHLAPGAERIALLMGPEGGLCEQEINRARQQGFQPLGLGPRVLRSETAPLAALSILQAQWGDMN